MARSGGARVMAGPDHKRAKPFRRRHPGESPGLLTRLRRDDLQALASGRFYHHTLIGRVPAELKLRIGQRWPGDIRRGEAVAAGEIELAGELVRHPAPRWFPPSAGPQWLAAWHSFGWIADLATAGGAAREATADLVQSWLLENAAWHGIAWRADVLATRVFAWVEQFDEIVRGAPHQTVRHAL